MLGGRCLGLPTTGVATLEEALRALKRLHPRVVIFVTDKSARVDDRLMLLRALLLLEENGCDNSLAILYDQAEGQCTLYHNTNLSGLSPEQVARAAAETVSCPLFGSADVAPDMFPKDCHYLPLAVKAFVEAAEPATAGPSE